MDSPWLQMNSGKPQWDPMSGEPHPEMLARKQQMKFPGDTGMQGYLQQLLYGQQTLPWYQRGFNQMVENVVPEHPYEMIPAAGSLKKGGNFLKSLWGKLRPEPEPGEAVKHIVDQRAPYTKFTDELLGSGETGIAPYKRVEGKVPYTEAVQDIVEGERGERILSNALDRVAEDATELKELRGKDTPWDDRDLQMRVYSGVNDELKQFDLNENEIKRASEALMERWKRQRGELDEMSHIPAQIRAMSERYNSDEMKKQVIDDNFGRGTWDSIESDSDLLKSLLDEKVLRDIESRIENDLLKTGDFSKGDARNLAVSSVIGYRNKWTTQLDGLPKPRLSKLISDPYGYITADDVKKLSKAGHDDLDVVVMDGLTRSREVVKLKDIKNLDEFEAKTGISVRSVWIKDWRNKGE